MFIPVILGTARIGRQSEKVARLIFEQLKSQNVDVEILDVRDYLPPATDNTGKSHLSQKLSQKITSASAIIIVTPEYNHGYPGELKMMLDLLYQEYFGKPVALCGVSGGGMGGVRAVEQLRLVAIELHLIPLPDALYFSYVDKLFDRQGKVQDKSYLKKTSSFIRNLISAVK